MATLELIKIRTFFLVVFTVFSAGIFLGLSLFQTHRSLLKTIQRIQEDISYKDGTWETSEYNADPLLPGTAPVYILAADGYVIERFKPLSGFLDASDFKHLLAFTQPQTIQTSTKQDWRIFSLPIEYQGKVLGVITVSSFHPIPETVLQLDKQLLTAAEFIKSQLALTEQGVVSNTLDERKIPHHISFQVVNTYNKIVLKSNNANSIDRLPNFIDPSYISQQLSSRFLRIIQDYRSRELFLVLTRPLEQEQNSPGGVIVIGKTISPTLVVISQYIVIIFLSGMTVVFIPYLTKVFSRFRTQEVALTTPLLSFDSTHSVVNINETKIPIVFSSNQYYLIHAVFSQKKKRWETDELLEKFGELPNKKSWRKVYDAMILVNKKTQPHLHKKLIVLDGKTFRFNPEFLP